MKSLFNKKKLTFLICIIFFSIGNIYALEELRILTASKDGVYFTAAKALKEVLKKDFRLIISTSSGSFYNIQKLGYGEADLAIAQADALHLYILLGKSVANRCLVIAPVQYEFIHIITNKKSNIKSFADLKDKKIAVGRKFSGSWVSAYLILQSENKTKFDKNPNILTISHNEAMDRMTRGEIDAMFITIVAGAPLVTSFFKKYGDKISLLSLRNDFSFSKRQINRFYSIRKILKNTYPTIVKDIYAAATPSFLLTYKYMNARLVKKLTGKIYQNASRLKKESDLWNLLDIKRAKKQIKRYIPYHKGAKSYIKTH